MGQFKPMVKMMTTEPTVELKLKKGGSATFARMKSEAAKEGFSPVKKMDGGVMGALSRTPAPTTALGNPAAARAMAAKRPARSPALPGRTVAAAPVRAATPMMKKGGEVETAAMHKAEMGAIKSVDKKLTKHASEPASKAHKGLKTGGVVHGQGGFKTGGVVKGQGGFKTGGSAKKAYATGGSVTNDSGRAVAMPKKAPSKPVAISQLSGTFKKGGRVC